MRYTIRACARTLGGVGCALAVTSTAAAAAVTPGWECIPTAAGQPVLSGGTGASPSCSSGTAVLAPTYVSSGVGGKPTVQFASINVQVVSGSGSTHGTVNGEGNLIVGYAENAHNYARKGSNDLVVGTDNGWSGYGELVGGTSNLISGPYAAGFGMDNSASGAETLVGGYQNAATGAQSSVSGGESNTAAGAASSVSGGEYNQATDSFASVVGGCDNLAGSGSFLTSSCGRGLESVLGGAENIDDGQASTVGGGDENIVNGDDSVAAGGVFNVIDADGAATIAGYDNFVNDDNSFLGGGCDNSTGSVAGDSTCPTGGGEGVVGGSGLSATATNGTYGAISDGANVGQSGTYQISLSLAAGQCALVGYGVPAAVKGDLAIVSYEKNPPSGLLLNTTGVTTTGTVEVNACNESSATVTYNNVPIRVETFR